MATREVSSSASPLNCFVAHLDARSGDDVSPVLCCVSPVAGNGVVVTVAARLSRCRTEMSSCVRFVQGINSSSTRIGRNLSRKRITLELKLPRKHKFKKWDCGLAETNCHPVLFLFSLYKGYWLFLFLNDWKST